MDILTLVNSLSVSHKSKCEVQDQPPADALSVPVDQMLQPLLLCKSRSCAKHISGHFLYFWPLAY